MLLAADNTALLGLHQILLSETAAGVLGRSVKYLRFRADGCNLASGHLLYI